MPKRAQYLRVITAELQRVASHLLWLGTWCMDMGGALGGGATIFLYCIRERELILDLFESLVGARLLYGFYPGRRRPLRHPGRMGATRAARRSTVIEQRIGEYERMLEDNPFFLARAQGVGVISRELAEDVGIAGPLLRGSGVELRPPPRRAVLVVRGLPVHRAGRDRGRLLRALPRADGRSSASRSGSSGRRSTGCPRARSRRGPALKSVAQIRIPKGEAYARVEGPRGEVGCYLIADGSAKPYRMKWRGASFSNLAVLPHIIPGHKVADVVAIMGSVDPVFGEVDR